MVVSNIRKDITHSRKLSPVSAANTDNSDWGASDTDGDIRADNDTEEAKNDTKETAAACCLNAAAALEGSSAA